MRIEEDNLTVNISTVTVDTQLDSQSTNPVENKAIQTALTTGLATKADSVHSHSLASESYSANSQTGAKIKIDNSTGKLAIVGGTNASVTQSYNATDGISTITISNTTPVATSAKSGLISAYDKSKLNSIQYSANRYILPVASTSTLGGVMVDGSTITINNGVVSAHTETEDKEILVDGVTVTKNSSDVLSVAKSVNCIAKGFRSLAVGESNKAYGPHSAVLNVCNTDYGSNSLVTGIHTSNKIGGVACNNNDKNNQSQYTNQFGNCGFKGLKSQSRVTCLWEYALTDIWIATVHVIDSINQTAAMVNLTVEFGNLMNTNYVFPREGQIRYANEAPLFTLLDGKLYCEVQSSRHPLYDIQFGIFYTLHSNFGPNTLNQASSSDGGEAT